MENTFLPLAHNFWNLVQVAFAEMQRTGNKTNIFSDYVTPEETINELFKRNDNNVGISIMFNFYHGLELYMKGLLQVENLTLTKSHNLKDLYKQIKANESRFTIQIIELLKKHICNTDNPFFKSNDIDINLFYIGLKYPEDKKGNKYNYRMIRGKEEETLKIYEGLNISIQVFRKELINWQEIKQKSIKNKNPQA